MRAQPPSKHDCADLLWEAIPLMAIADRSSPQPRRWSDDGADRRRYRPAFSWKAIALKTSCKGQCIMKERPASEGRSWRGAEIGRAHVCPTVYGAGRRRYRPAFSWKAIALKTSCKGQCIMKERPASEGRSWRGA